MQALKFFGYVHGWNVDEREIFDEMDIMASMNHVESVVRIYGYLCDTKVGLIPSKVCQQGLPVIVMEHLSGGPLFGRLNYQDVISEKYLASVFKAIVDSVGYLHAHRFIHRDLKLENIMYLNSSDHSPVRIIDLGMSTKLNEDDVFIDTQYLVGTPGFYAPESLTRQEYSVKTDIWQLGCILYMLLSGLPPFHRDRVSQITQRGYYKMEGKGWTDVSDSAKDLVQRVLRRDAALRLSVEEILAHPWLAGEAAATSMDTDYKTRIKRLALRDKMQLFFRESKLSASNAERQSKLIANVPLLRVTSLSVKKQKSSAPTPPLPRNGSSVNLTDVVAPEVDPDFNPDLAREISEFGAKLKNLKTMVVRHMSLSVDGAPVQHEIDYDAFVAMLHKCNLEELCTPAVFNIFDIGNTGTVDPKEFLMTMIAFRPFMAQGGLQVPGTPGSLAGGAEEGGGDLDCDAEARLHFDIFDIKETGYIDIEELRLAVKFLLFMGADEPQDMPNVEDMFHSIDLANNGRIDFDEFKTFYKHLLSHSNSFSVSVKKGQS